MAVLFWMLLVRPQQNEQRRRRELMNQLKKNDRVVTNGGLIGTIADLSADGRFVTLKVDDSTRIRFLRSGHPRSARRKTRIPRKEIARQLLKPRKFPGLWSRMAAGIVFRRRFSLHIYASQFHPAAPRSLCDRGSPQESSDVSCVVFSAAGTPLQPAANS
ncbi:MAG UNVERIFIED_CONTAM: preprotein translocase subunit YajC [Planctomycetaceae bacterium]